MTDVSVLSAKEAVEFLEWLDPAGLHNLVAIDPTGAAPIEARTFGSDALERDALYGWISEHNGKRNLYFSVNAPKPDARQDTKLRRDEIGAVRAFHVDIDNLEGEPDWDPDCLPSAVIDSGGGRWGLWKLAEPVPVEDVAQLEAQNRALTARFAGDAQAHNLDRIARLPGTLNIPNAAKRKKGRVERVARMLAKTALEYHPDEIAEWCPPMVVAQNDSHSAKADQAPLAELDTPAAVAKAARWLLTDAPEAVEGEGGDATTYQVAARLKDFGVSRQTAFDLLLDGWNENKATPPWPAAELLGKVRNAFAFGTAAPGRNSPATAETEFDAVGIDSIDAVYDPLHPPGLPPLYAVTSAAVASIKAREWLVGKFLARGYLAALGAPPGSGKTQMLAKIAVAAVTGRGDILGPGFELHQRTRVFMWNQEDEKEEMLRRCGAEMQYYGISDEDLLVGGEPGIVIGSGVEHPLLVSRPGADGMMVDTQEARRLTEYLAREGFGIAMFDPFAEMHAASEEADNVMIGRAGGAFRRIAINARVASLIATHTRKPSNASAESHAGSMDALRGASALAGVCRMIATLFELDAKTAKEFGIPEEERNRYVRFDDAKANMSLKRSAPLFFKREGVRLPTSDGKTEEVGALLPRQMSKVEKSAKPGDTLVEDAKALLAGGGLWIGELVEQLMLLPMYSDNKEATIKQRVRRAFAPAGDSENAKNTNGVAWELRVKPGTRAREARLELHE